MKQSVAMNKFLHTLIPLVVLLISLANPARSQSMTTSFSYDFSRVQPTPTLSLQGQARFQPDSPHLRLSPTDASGGVVLSTSARAVHSDIITLQSGGFLSDFESTLKFRITPIDSFPADGLTFFIGPVGFPLSYRAIGGNMGLFDEFGSAPGVFAVEFDTMPNAWDPDYVHIGLDLQFRKSGNTTRVDDGILGQEVTAVIRYDAANKFSSVRVSTAGGKNFEVSHVHDLYSFLPEHVQVGLSASTGRHVAMHDIISWTWNSTIVFG